MELLGFFNDLGKTVKKFDSGGGIDIDHSLKDYKLILANSYAKYRKEGLGLQDAIDTSFRDLGLETQGKFDKKILDKFLSDKPAWQKYWKEYKKFSDISIEDGYYVNPYQTEYGKGGKVKLQPSE